MSFKSESVETHMMHVRSFKSVIGFNVQLVRDLQPSRINLVTLPVFRTTSLAITEVV